MSKQGSSSQGPKLEKKQSTLMGFFGKPKPGPAPRPASTGNKDSTTASPASTALRTPSSVTATSPAIPASSSQRQPPSSPIKAPVRVSTPLKSSLTLEESENELTPPPTSAKNAPASEQMEVEDDTETVMDADESPVVSMRRAKRKVVYVESESETESETAAKLSAVKAGRKPRKSLKADSDSDDFIMGDDDDDAFAAAMDEYETSALSPSLSAGSATPPPRTKKALAKSKGFAQPKPVARKGTGNYQSSPPPSSPASGMASSSRPPLKPLTGGSGRQGSGKNGSNSNSFITGAERRKEEAAQRKRESEDCFDFIKPENIKDKYGNRPDHPDYDKRTILVPKNTLEKLSPFERQFWNIKQDHFDTVLFFQKGKFFELYEEDARIGHRDFDLKLTERVKMCMVGVPEQSFEFWAAKFLAAGYKVGKVEQAETAIGKEMRTKGGQQDKIVRRELAQVFTNGTIVDPTYLTTDEANHCVAIKEYVDEATGLSSFGICTLDASTGEFNLSAFEDDVVRTRLQTTFRQIRPKELVHAKGNLTVDTQRMLRNMLPSSTLWQSFRDHREFYSSEETLRRLSDIFETADDDGTVAKMRLPEAIETMLDTPVAMEALGGMLFYLNSLNLDKDLISQKNFNIYDPLKEGKNLVLDGVTLGHMEVLVNNEGGTEGTLLELLQLCQTPSGKRLFRIWLSSPLLDPVAINERLDAVEDLMVAPTFTSAFRSAVRKLPDLERLLSRLHAGSIKESAFLGVVEGFETIEQAIDNLTTMTNSFVSASVGGLLRTAPDLQQLIKRIRSLYTTVRTEKTVEILPTPGADEDTDNAVEAVNQTVSELEDLLANYKRKYKMSDLTFWHSAQGGKDIYQLQVPSKTKVPENWTKQGGTAKANRYYTSEIRELVRAYQEAKETETAAKKSFYRRLLGEFDQDRTEWLKAVRIIAELDCLISLALASHNLDEPKCRPVFVESDQAFVDFEELRHPSMCLRSDFIANDVKLGSETGEDQARTVLLTGPNMAGKSTLLRMTAAGIIMAQMGCFVPAAKARLSPIDKIQTRMGAYDNMFASASTFKVELDECARILREAGPKSFVILDELGRGTSTYDGMAIAGAVLHHLATHTLPLAFFATHYGSLTDDYGYHPNIQNMHMKTHVDDDLKQVVFLYKLIPGVAESSHGTHVARMAGVDEQVVERAESISDEFFQAFKIKLRNKRQSASPLEAQADFVFLVNTAMKAMKKQKGIEEETEDDAEMAEGGVTAGKRWKMASIKDQLNVIRRSIGTYEK